MKRSVRRTVWKYLLIEEDDTFLERFVTGFLLLLIVLSTLGVILTSMEEVDAKIGDYFDVFEVICGVIFSIEYLLRLWAAPEDPEFRGKWGRIRYMFTPLAIVDLLAIVPFWLPFVSTDLIMLRSVRLLRLVRLLRVGRYSRSIQLLAKVLKERAPDLAMGAFVGFILIIISSCIMYLAERDAQPDKFSSIPAAMWWAVATLTTVGYGDVYPVTVLGRIAATIVEILGIGVFALPAGILGAGFVDALQQNKERRPHYYGATCPNCGHEFSIAAGKGGVPEEIREEVGAV